MAKTWAKFYDEVIPEMPGCPLALAADAIRRSAIDFCNDSRCYRLDHPALSAVANQPAYAWAPGTNLVVVRAETVWYDSKKLDVKGSKELDTVYARWPTESGTPLYFLQEDPTQLILVPYPSAALAGAIVAKVSVKPSQAATDIVDWIWEEYRVQIGAGAKAALMTMGDKPWTNLTMGAKYLDDYELGKALAMMRAERGYTRSTVASSAKKTRFM